MKFSIEEWIFHIQVQDKELNFIEMFNNKGLIIGAKLTWNLPFEAKFDLARNVMF